MACKRCGIAADRSICIGCRRDAEIAERRMRKIPACGTCSDSGRVPADRPLRFAGSVRFDEIDESLGCPDCTRDVEPVPFEVWGSRDGEDRPLSSHFDAEDAAAVAQEYAPFFDEVRVYRDGVVTDLWGKEA